MALSISTASRRKTPPCRSRPRLIRGIRSFHPAGTLSVRDGTRTTTQPTVRTAIRVILPEMLFHMVRGRSFRFLAAALSGGLLRFRGRRLLAGPGDRAPRHLHAHLLGDFKGDGGLREPLDLAVEPSGGHHAVPRLEVLDEVLVLPGLLLLRPDEEEVEDHEHEQDRQEPHEPPRPAARGTYHRVRYACRQHVNPLP